MTNDFQSAYRKVHRIYVKKPMIDPKEAMPHLDHLTIILESMGENIGSSELRLACRQAIAPKHLADYLLPLHLLEYSMEILKWPLVRPVLEELLNEQTDPGIRLKFEVVIRRVYEPDWQGGDCKSIELEESVWDYLRESTN